MMNQHVNVKEYNEVIRCLKGKRSSVPPLLSSNTINTEIHNSYNRYNKVSIWISWSSHCQSQSINIYAQYNYSHHTYSTFLIVFYIILLENTGLYLFLNCFMFGHCFKSALSLFHNFTPLIDRLFSLIDVLWNRNLKFSSSLRLYRPSLS